MRKKPVEGLYQKKECPRLASQYAQKGVPEKKTSLLNSVLGEDLEHDPAELEC